jgi:hypothetical protein
MWPQKDNGFCGLATRNTAKTIQDRLKANLKDHWSKEIWPPSSKDCNPLDYFMWSEVEREVNKHPHNTLASINAKILVVMARIDGRSSFLLARESSLGLRLLWRPMMNS